MLSDNDTLKLYMQNISKYPLITLKEEGELAKRIAAGDANARSTLIRGNLRLVVKIAHDFKGYGLPLLDLISEGNIGLMRAVEKFDPTKGAKLSSYAAWWIKQAMRRALSNQGPLIRIPVQSAAKIGKIHNAKIKLAEKLGRDPTDKEIAAEVNLTERTVNGLRQGKTSTVSMQAPIKEGEEGELKDVLADEKSLSPNTVVEETETLNYMNMLIGQLDERERAILTLRFGLNGDPPKTLEQVSAEIGRTRERVRQIQNQALEKLRSRLEEDGRMDDEMFGHFEDDDDDKEDSEQEQEEELVDDRNMPDEDDNDPGCF